MRLFLRKTVQYLRRLTPLWIRVKIGPIIAYGVYFTRVYLSSNKHAPKVLSIEKTIEKIATENLSVIRFGDGEISIMEDIDLGFQKKDHELSSKLRVVLQSNLTGLLICVPGLFGKLSNFKSRSFWFTIHHLFKHGYLWRDLLSRDQVYGDAFMTRPYLTYKNTSSCGEIFKKLFSIWENKEVVLVEGLLSRLGVGNDMFNNAKSIQRILCPAENAYGKYSIIKETVLKVPKNKIILLSLGPAAKVLAYELFLLGYRVVDIGHIDMEYEMFIRGKTTIQKVQYKYFNEIKERTPEECLDPTYMKQIMTIIE
jgi:glycosyltransferase family protein